MGKVIGRTVLNKQVCNNYRNIREISLIPTVIEVLALLMLRHLISIRDSNVRVQQAELRSV